jgi:antitoxin FitA
MALHAVYCYHNEKGAIAMNAMTIRKIDDDLKQRLAARAASNRRSMEAEARSILRAALVPVAVEENMADIALRLFGPEHGFDDFPTIERTPVRIIDFEL